eukprot:gb/GECH01001895.1/.p1 GENE.gb/GECH01001895.1/~~gb/GECH01001895.1/.p1  ORF type:complete len:315 (+),score=73.78 gb/GECH01001895.1/:1-945(+)
MTTTDNNTNTQFDKHQVEFEEFSSLDLKQLEEMISNMSLPLAERNRVLWQIKAFGGEAAVHALAKGFVDHSPLMRHEIAYAMGQLKHKSALPILNQLLSDTTEDCMVRHEAAEALGAIGSPDSIQTLEKYLQDELREVRETCEIAIDRIRYMQEQKDTSLNNDNSIYTSVDPAPADDDSDIIQLREVYLDPSANLFRRYKAMFALRNIGTTEAVKALCEGLNDESSLFKHEVAFVLGQLGRSEAAEPLVEVLKKPKEHPMVRHEAAEALGTIADPDTLSALEEYTGDDVRPVKESCEVALDMHDYWTKFNGSEE